MERLVDTYGALPSTHALRVVSTDRTPETWTSTRRDGWRQVSRAVSRKPLDPALPDAAFDEQIGVVVDELRRLTRPSKQFPRVQAENVSFGFHRNLVGVRPYGVSAALISSAVAIAVLVSRGDESAIETTDLVVALVVSGCVVVFFVLFVTLRRAWDAGVAYVEALMEAVASIAADTASSPNDVGSTAESTTAGPTTNESTPSE